MTKEEVIDSIIDDYKNGNQSAMSDYCDRTKCSGCPFNTNICVDDTHNILIERLLKAEEHQETNFDHYIKSSNSYVTTYENNVTFKLKDGWEESFENFDIDNFRDWLLSPYEEPKPKYKLSQFGYDLLDFCKQYNDELVITDWAVLKDMHDKGHFKGVPTDVPIKDILDNCEVVEE